MNQQLPIGAKPGQCPECRMANRVAADYKGFNEKLLSENRKLTAEIKEIRCHALTALRQLNVIAGLSVTKRQLQRGAE